MRTKSYFRMELAPQPDCSSNVEQALEATQLSGEEPSADQKKEACSEEVPEEQIAEDNEEIMRLQREKGRDLVFYYGLLSVRSGCSDSSHAQLFHLQDFVNVSLLGSGSVLNRWPENEPADDGNASVAKIISRFQKGKGTGNRPFLINTCCFCSIKFNFKLINTPRRILRVVKCVD